MAAAVSSSAILDLKAQATFPIRLGGTISKPATSKRFASVRYNYRPAWKSAGEAKAKIEEGEDVGEQKLLLEVGEGAYTYAGKYDQEESSFVLVLRGEGKDREMILERLDGSHSFNLIGTPSESDAAVLASKHPQLSTEPADEDDLFGDDDMPPDDSNPFDFRHFLRAELEKPQNTQPVAESSRSTLGSSLVAHATPSASLKKAVKPTPAKTAAAKKRKTPAAEKANPKKPKTGQEPTPAAEAPRPKAKTEAPKIRVDRKASVARKPSFDDGELILENETPVSEKPPQHKGAMALALSGQLGGGPISLMSAASSPRIASPAPEKEVEEVHEYEFEFGNSSSPEPEDGGDVDMDGEDDADVDDLELPSPAQKRQSVAAPPAAPGGEDEEDDMEKQLALAMAADDSEESEEE